MNGPAAGASSFWNADRIRDLLKPVAMTVAIVVGIWLLLGGFDWTFRIAGAEIALRFGGVEGLFRYLCRGAAGPAASQAATAGGIGALLAVALKYAFIVGTPVALFGALRSRDPRVRAILFQIVVIALFVALVWYLVANTIENLERRQIRSGFDFLCSSYGSQIDETLIEWKTEGTYARAFIVGLLNTVKVGFIGIVLATVLGTIIGVARLSPNWLVAKLASGYVEIIRNIPLLLQLTFLYTLFLTTLPDQTSPGTIAGNIFVSKSGILFPLLNFTTVHYVMLALVLAGVVVVIGYNMWVNHRRDTTGQAPSRLWPSLAILFVPALLVFLAAGLPNEWDIPRRTRFRLEGGGSISPEFMAILTGLVLYTAGFIAEIVRSGILAVSYGQTEAAAALGLTRGQVLRTVILPQAMRVIIPPMTSQYLNLIKNSSLGVAIGYPELVAIANISMNQAGRALECVLIIMAVYLSVSLSIAVFMNWYNKKIALVERNTVTKRQARAAKAAAAAAE